MKYFIAELTTNGKQQGYQGSFSDIMLRVDGQVEEPYETAIPSNNSTWESDLHSFTFDEVIAEIFLELRENLKTVTGDTGFLSEKVKYILDINRQIYMKLLIKP